MTVVKLEDARRVISAAGEEGQGNWPAHEHRRG
jgi:hypothetical protein